MSTSRIAAPALIGLYVAAALSPLALSLLVCERGDDPFAYKIGLSMGLVGFSLLALQFVLAARLKWAERPFGLDSVYQFHRAMGVLAFVLIFGHPVVLAAAHHKWSLLFGLHVHWYIWLGRAALALLAAHVLLAVFRAALKLEYERWKAVHNGLAVLVLGGAFVHSWFAGGDLKPPAMRVLWVILLGAALAAYLWHRAGRPARLRRRAYRVTEVRQEAADVWTVSLAPKDGSPPPAYLPGQYHYLTLCRDGQPTEEHPFTISSSPSRPGVLASTIKASGDYTRTVRETRPGDDAWVNAPYGRFSYVLHPDERALVFIAGGVGVTPLMSMLRHVCDTQAPQSVLLLYANRTEDDIIFREELAALEGDPAHHLRVIHVLSKPGKGWGGEAGRLDAAKIKKYSGDIAGKGFYICGPTGLIASAASCLKDMGVPDRHVHFESFGQ